MKNIDDLAGAKTRGFIRGKQGDSFKIRKVRLDIGVPPGYDVKNLTDVISHAKSKGVDYSIHVMPK